MSGRHPFRELIKDFSEERRSQLDVIKTELPITSSSDDVPSWRALEDIKSDSGLETECERFGKLGAPRQSSPCVSDLIRLCR